MDRFKLSAEGTARFRRMRLDSDTPASRIEGYEILDCLYENGAGTVEEITNYTGLPRDQVWNKLTSLVTHGYIEGVARR
jgi:hypothetical protein